MRPPIFVFEDGEDARGDLLVFSSATRAERYLEWQDIARGTYRAHDSAGRLLRFTHEPGHPEAFRIVGCSTPANAGEAAHFRRLLEAHLARVLVPPRSLTLPELADLAYDLFKEEFS
jgi:hypothetical protein